MRLNIAAMFGQFLFYEFVSALPFALVMRNRSDEYHGSAGKRPATTKRTVSDVAEGGGAFDRPFKCWLSGALTVA